MRVVSVYAKYTEFRCAKDIVALFDRNVNRNCPFKARQDRQLVQYDIDNDEDNLDAAGAIREIILPPLAPGMPGYTKFIKDLFTKIRKVIHETEDNLHHCGAISTRSLVQKKAGLGAFTIPCTIGSLDFTKALCDLGASINLMLLVVFKKLGLGDPTPTNLRLVMADRSIKWLIDVLHDVLVKVADFIFLADFVILHCELDFKVPIILGRPFLVTGRVLVDTELNRLKFRLKGKDVSFKVHQSMRQKKEISVFLIVDVFYEDGRDTPVELGMKHFLDPPKEILAPTVPENMSPKRINHPAPQPEDPLGEPISHEEFRATFTTLAQFVDAQNKWPPVILANPIVKSAATMIQTSPE
ncbi:uncharacterized protein LOC124887877 [Capsicum annuum]|uniref:uncharacterized protein LOC124887877 n=1 Tax=Capsicum annuum TaxID=4072 RepID=UPI001FB1085F|nr:uncharacterized protein LOC124887877 [Capsicum annuum]